MTNVRKKISDLTALTSASLDTTIVGVDNGTTYKIELDTLADAVTSRVNILDRSRLSALESVTSSYETKGSSIVSSSTQIISLGFVSSSTLNSYTSSQSTLNTAFQIAIEGRLQTSSFNSFSSSVHSEIVAATNEQSFNGLISGSSQLTSSFDTRYTLSGSLKDGIVSSSAQVLGGSGVVSGSYETTGRNIVSGSSQLTSSLDTRYALSASYLTSLSGAISSSTQITNGSGIVSGSSQLTSSYDTRYLTIGGDGVISGSSQLPTLATTGSNTFTGTNTFRGTSRFETVGGDEGGEIEFGVPQTNTTLSTRVVADIFQNRFRMFDGNTNGVFIDLSKAPIGVAGEITWKASGYVNAGTFVQLDNVKVTIPTSGNRGASIGAVSTTFVANISGQFGYSGGAGGISANNVTYTTTASASAFGWNFGAEGDSATYILNDKTNSRVYRIIIMIGLSYNNNFISIERLH